MTSLSTIWCWFLCLVFLIDSANLLQITGCHSYQLEDGELLALIDNYEDEATSPSTSFPPEPDEFENTEPSEHTFYDVDSPLLPNNTETQDQSFAFFKPIDPFFYPAPILSEILYLKNCTLII